LEYLLSLSSISKQRTREKQALLAAQERAREKYKGYAAEQAASLARMGLSVETLEPKTLEALDELVKVGMVVGVDPLNSTVLDIAKGVSDQIDREMELELRLVESRDMEKMLSKELARMTTMKQDLELIQRNVETRQDTLDEKISEWTRGIKLLQAKTEEYLSRTSNAKVHLKFSLTNLAYSRGIADWNVGKGGREHGGTEGTCSGATGQGGSICDVTARREIGEEGGG